MSLSRTVHTLINDIGHLNRLYQQLEQVPSEVDSLFRQIDTTYGLLIDVGVQIACRDVSILFDSYIHAFTQFRSIILELELFIDPRQSLPRSGYGSHVGITTASWTGVTGPELVESCDNFGNSFSKLDKECMELLSILNSTSPHNNTEILSREKDAGMALNFPTPPSPFLLDPSTRPSPFLQPQFTPLTSPRLSPRKLDVQPVATISMAGLISGMPFSEGVPQGDTMGHLPSLTSSTVTRRRRHGRKTLAERKVAELLQQQYGKSVAAGTKRKRHEPDTSNPAGQQSALNVPPSFNRSAQPAIPSTPPPTYPPSSPRLGPRSDPPETHPAWSLDDLNDSLPPLPPSAVAKGKQRASPSANDLWDSGSSANTGSSANSAHSSIREGSLLSTASRDRMFDDGAVKIWYHQGTGLRSVTIIHMEVRRTSRPSGDGTVIIARTSSNQDIVHDLWLSEKKMNACPFIDNCEILAAMQDQHDSCISAMVHFAPNLTKHPQYSFTSKQDCWEFMQMVTGKTLIASVDIATIKSACTHGNAAESGCETIQMWEDPDPATTRFIKFFRNKNGQAVQPIVEVNVNCLRAPAREGRTRKLTFAFRDVQRGTLREMSYLKIAFSNDSAENEFLDHCGFTAASGSKA